MLRVLLPGMDGTGTLFGALSREMQVVSYPTQIPLNYEALEALIRRQLPLNQPYIVVAESFSGPIGVQLAADPPAGLEGVVLVASFVRRPWGRLGMWLARLMPDAILGAHPPRWLLHWFLMNRASQPEVLSTLTKAVRAVKSDVLAERVRAALTVDVSAEWARARVPILWLAAEDDRLLSFSRNPANAIVLRGPHLLLQCVPERCIEALAQHRFLD